MMFVIIFSILGLVMLQVSNIEYINTAVSTTINLTNSTTTSFETIDLTTTGLGLFNVQSFLVLTYWWFMILSVLNFAIGKKETRKDE